MSQGNQSYLRFSMEESVWFQKGQEVAELLSISLDPNITIQENDQYVTIRGSLELTGEYKRYEDEFTEEEDFFSAPKFVHNVEERGEGVYEFSHRFPVDITIPNNRIQSVYDVDVTVESFDYLFSERSCLKLSADLAITGLYGEQQHGAAEVEIEEEIELEPAYRYEAVEETVEETEVYEELEEVQAYEEVEVEQEEEVEEEAEEEEIEIPFKAEARKIPSVDEVTETEYEEAQAEYTQVPVTPEISFSAQRSENVPVVENEAVEEEVLEEVPVEEMYEEPEVESSSSEEEVKKKKSSKKKGLSIAEFLARKEEGADSARLRVCIVQHGDTVDSIAERYEVSVQQLLRVNHIELNQDVYEGQVLYVPYAVTNS